MCHCHNFSRLARFVKESQGLHRRWRWKVSSFMPTSLNLLKEIQKNWFRESTGELKSQRDKSLISYRINVIVDFDRIFSLLNLLKVVLRLLTPFYWHCVNVHKSNQENDHKNCGVEHFSQFYFSPGKSHKLLGKLYICCGFN